MNIRDAREEELATIREQRVEAYGQYASRIPAGHWKALEGSLSSQADRQPGVELLVAESESDGRIAGSVVLFPPKSNAYEGHVEAVDHPEIRMLAVDAAYRGEGVATALIAACIERSRAKGYRAIGLHTGEFMEPALRLYEKIGFERQPEHDFQPADDGIVVKAFRLSIG
ncbi:GNAT family N-acetyltransferase [Cohnella suwonensis]|uniref:GNAT family N-acetyltransferase n=1 Tax=Cohnella suwonensis TaxID=696072 RepID=A0ABW0LU18_9BACL